MHGALVFATEGAVASAKAGGAPAPMPGPGGEPAAVGIEQLAFLVGGVWVAAQVSMTVCERVSWDAEQRFLLTEVTQEIGGQVVGEARGSFGYSPSRRYLMSGATSTSGTYTGGYEVASSGTGDGCAWVFAMVIGSGAQIQNVQVTMRHPSTDQLVIEQAMLQGGVWITQGSVTYLRQAAGR